MYIVAIAWLYVVLMMSITELSVIAGIMTFLLYGVFPLSIILYLMGSTHRKRKRAKAEIALRDQSIQSESIAGTSEDPAKDDNLT